MVRLRRAWAGPSDQHSLVLHHTHAVLTTGRRLRWVHGSGCLDVLSEPEGGAALSLVMQHCALGLPQGLSLDLPQARLSGQEAGKLGVCSIHAKGKRLRCPVGGVGAAADAECVEQTVLDAP